MHSKIDTEKPNSRNSFKLQFVKDYSNDRHPVISPEYVTSDDVIRQRRDKLEGCYWVKTQLLGNRVKSLCGIVCEAAGVLWLDGGRIMRRSTRGLAFLD